jgi:hypothetical protein
MATVNDLYIANLAFFLNYEDGYTDDEISYEIFKIAFQDKETVHYDRRKGGNFGDIEQERDNVATAMWFTSNMIESIYFVNNEKNNNPYIVVGYNDIVIESKQAQDGEYLITVTYKLLSDITETGVAKIK